MRRLGIDPGAKRVGLAHSEAESDFAHPLTTLEGGSPQQVAARIAEVARRERAQELVLGLPLLMNGQEGPAARKARALATALEAELDDVRVVLWDERLTTVSAERQLRDSGLSGRKQRKVVDQAAATVLLQSYLDGLASRREMEP